VGVKPRKYRSCVCACVYFFSRFSLPTFVYMYVLYSAYIPNQSVKKQNDAQERALNYSDVIERERQKRTFSTRNDTARV